MSFTGKEALAWKVRFIESFNVMKIFSDKMGGNMAQKKLSERIAERAQKQESGGRKQQYQAIFLSLREEIEEAHKAGWKVKAIWETLHLEKKFNGTYECFLSYFNKKIREDYSTRS